MKNTNVVATYDYYTLEQARQIIAEENRQNAIRSSKIKARKKADAIYYTKQKLCGLVLAAMGLIIPLIDDWNITACFLLIPLGLLLIFSKKKIMMF